ncbi:MAG TPA: LptF/LptG family permease [Candidatus Binatus sp.]|nr:LptF/LptG family permease [Candidatus Binatus sp.]
MTRLDRYMISELGGPFLFGLAAFTLLFVAGELLNVARLVSEEHASLLAAAKYFIYTLPQTLVLTFPMSMLLAVLLAMSRLSGDSEITGIRAGGVSLYRIAAPIAAVGLLASLVGLGFQEFVVPGATARANEILQSEIQSGNVNILSNEVVRTSLPNGDAQVTYAAGFDTTTQSLEQIAVQVYRDGTLLSLLVAPRAHYQHSTWVLTDAISYRLAPICCTVGTFPFTSVNIGASPTDLIELAKRPEDLSRNQLRPLVRSAKQSGDKSRYALLLVTYDSKLARPFASLVFTMLAIPLGIRRQRSTSGAGFGISIAIVFAFYVVTTICLALGRTTPELSLVMAWLPNIVFGAIGIWLLQLAAKV